MSTLPDEQSDSPLAATSPLVEIADSVEYALDPASVTVARLTALIWVGSIAAPLWLAGLLVGIFAPLPLLVKLMLLALLAAKTAFFTSPERVFHLAMFIITLTPLRYSG